MKKLYVKDMNTEDLRLVFEANEQIRRTVSDIHYEDTVNFICDMLKSFDRNSVDYCITWDYDHYIKVKNYRYFLDDLNEAQKEYNIINDHDLVILKKANILLNSFDELEGIVEDEEILDLIYNEFEKTCDDLAEAIDDYFTSLCNDSIFDTDEQRASFLECYYDMFLDCYVDLDEDTYVLYEDIRKRKSYK